MTTTIVQNNFPEVLEVKKESFKNSNKDVSAFQQVLLNNSSEQKKEDKKSLSSKDINALNEESDQTIKAENKNKQQIDKSDKFPNKNNIAKTKEVDSIVDTNKENGCLTINNIELPTTAIDQDQNIEIAEVQTIGNIEYNDSAKILPIEENLNLNHSDKVVTDQKINSTLLTISTKTTKNLNDIENNNLDNSFELNNLSNFEVYNEKSVNITDKENISNQNILSKELVDKTEEFEIDNQQSATKQNSDVIAVPQTIQNIMQDQTSVDNNIDVKTEPKKIIDENKIDIKLNGNSAIENEESKENAGTLNQNITTLVCPNIDNKDNKNIDDLKLNSLNAPQNNISDDYNLAQDNLSDRRDNEYQNDDPIFDKVILNKNEEKITLSFKELSTDFAENIPHRVDQINLAVRAGLQNGNKEISLNMYPEALGNVDVKIEFDKDQVISVKIFVEKPETLRILVKDVAILEKSLSEVIKADDASLSFNLKDGGKGNEYQPADKIINKFNVTNSNLVVNRNYQVNISSTTDGVNITV